MCLALAGGLAGCAPAPAPVAGAIRFDPCAGLTLLADPGLSAETTGGVAAGIELWNQAAHARVVMGEEPGDHQPAAALAAGGADEGQALPIHFQAAGAPFHGLYDPAGAQIFINTDLAGHDRVVAVAHEVGHAFGLVHVPLDQRRSVMNAGNLDEEPNAGDVAALAAIWGACPSQPPPPAPAAAP